MIIETLTYPQTEEGKRDYYNAISLDYTAEELGYEDDEWIALDDDSKLEIIREAITGLLHCEIVAERDAEGSKP